MFSFLHPRPELRLGVELSGQTWTGVLVDAQGLVQQRRQLPAPPEGERFETLRSLLQHFPLPQCHIVLSLPPEYHWKVWQLESRDAVNIRNQSERWLPYCSADASYAWHALGPKNTLIGAYPSELLFPLNAAVVSLKARSVAWEIPDMACLRTLTQAGLPGALVDLRADHLRIAAASEGEYYSFLNYRTNSQELDLLQHVERFVHYLKNRGKEVPEWLLVNVPPAQLPGWACRPLHSDYLAIELAHSPPGPHQFRIPR